MGAEAVMDVRERIGESETWHEMFDAICVEQGHLDNMRLADGLCAAAGNQTETAFHAALKNLSNWRSGSHIPQRRNFLLLTAMLGIDQSDGMRAKWNELYGRARSRTPAEPAADAPMAVPPDRRRYLVVGAGAVLGILAVAAGATLMRPAEPEDGSFAGIEAEYRKNVTVKVGDAIIIHGARGNDCGPAPDWEVTRKLLPELTTGKLSDGGVGTRFSRQCDGLVAARAILFTATTLGTEQTALYGDPITIHVQ